MKKWIKISLVFLGVIVVVFGYYEYQFHSVKTFAFSNPKNGDKIFTLNYLGKYKAYSWGNSGMAIYENLKNPLSFSCQFSIAEGGEMNLLNIGVYHEGDRNYQQVMKAIGLRKKYRTKVIGKNTYMYFIDDAGKKNFALYNYKK